jgi:hypothetical protein
MHVSFERDEFGQLFCALSNAGPRTAIAVSDAFEAAAGLLGALDAAADGGCGECYWPQPGGQYRWMLRRDGARVRIVILWMAGVLTGWEHVYWGECDFEEFAHEVRDQLRPYQTAER